VNNPTGRTDVKDLPDEVPVDEMSVKNPAKAAPSRTAPPSALPEATAVPKPAPKLLTAVKPAPRQVVRPKVTPKAAAKSTVVAHKPVTPAAVPAPKIAAADKSVEAVKASPPVAATLEAVKPAPASPTAPLAKAAVPKTAAEPAPTRVSFSVPGGKVKPTLKPSAPKAAPTIASKPPVAPSPAPALKAAPAAVKTAPKALVAQAPKTTALERAVTEPVNAKPALAPSETPSFTGQRPAETPMAEVNPQLRTSLPASRRMGASSPAETPKAVKPAVQPRSGVKAPAQVKPAAPVRIARAETHSTTPLGNARTEESNPAPVSPAAHRIAAARPPLRIMLGQEPVEFDVQPVIEKGIAIAPLRQIIEHTGGMVMWLPSTRTVQASSGPQTIEVKIGSRRAKVNAQIILMDRPATLTSGRTMVPVRFLQTALNMKALYDPTKGLVYLYRP
jgi:hypothetical protein